VIDSRFDLDLTVSGRLVGYSDERGSKNTLYLVLDPDSAASTPALNPLPETGTHNHKPTGRQQ
jgi:hypothetical protein